MSERPDLMKDLADFTKSQIQILYIQSPLTTDINKAFHSTQLLPTGYFLFLGPLIAKRETSTVSVLLIPRHFNLPKYTELLPCDWLIADQG